MPNKGDLMIAEARKHLGQQYVHAGHGPDVFDCSGFTHWCAEIVDPGIDIPYTVDGQHGCGTEVSLANARPGDLVLYAEPKGSDNFVHASMYISPTEIIHAANEDQDVCISNGITGSWYVDRLTSIRRLWPYDDAQAPSGTAAVAPKQLTFSPSYAYPTQSIRWTAAGFKSGETVSLRWSTEAGVVVATAVANSSGVAVGSYTLGSASPNNYPYWATAPSGSVKGTLQIVNKPSAVLTFDPPTTPSKSTVNWTATGFRSNELVDLHWASPAGVIVATDVADSSGMATYTYTLGSAADGAYPLYAVGRTSGVTVQGTLNIKAAQTTVYTHKIVNTETNLRQGTSTSATIYGVMPVGTRLYILAGPMSYNGYDWYKVQPEGFQAGYCIAPNVAKI